MPAVARRADRWYLRDVAYADPSGLTARASLYDHQHPRIDLVGEALDMLDPIAGRVVGDVGCGNGRYVGALRAGGARVIGIDLSFGMLVHVPPPRPELVVADAQAIPLASGSLDALLMMHMLYHAPDPERAVVEARRVLEDGGRILLGTNGPRHLAEMDELWVPVLDRAGGLSDLEDAGLVNARLTARNARRLLEEHFADVDERWRPSSVVVTDPSPVMRHAASTTGAHTVGEQRDELLDELAESVGAQIRRDGEFRITTEVVFFAGRKS
jgi:SAM-dependent methyltransferase